MSYLIVKIIAVIYGYLVPDYLGATRLHKIQYVKTTSNDLQIRAIQIGPINEARIPFYPSFTSHSAIQGVKKRVIHDFYLHIRVPKRRLLQEHQNVRDRDLITFFNLSLNFDEKDHLINQYRPFIRNTEIWHLHEFICKHILPKLEPLPPIGDEDEAFEHWLARYDRPMSRKQEIRFALDKLRDNCYNLRRYTGNKVFLKNEPYEEMKYPRCICPREDVIVAQFGPIIHALEEYIFHASPLSKYFVKGLTPEEQIAKLKTEFPDSGVFIETDYSSFEGSFNPLYQHLVEITYFRHMLKFNPFYLHQLEHLYKGTHLRCPFYSIHTKGSRMSGDLWTSLMNGLSNLSNMLYLMNKLGVTGTGVVEGDDGLFTVSSRAIQPQHFAALGFNIKLEYTYALNHCCFCQKIFHPDTLHLICPPELLNRIGWCDNKLYFKQPKLWKPLLLAKAYSYLVLYPCSPMISPCMKKIIKSIEPINYLEVIRKFKEKQKLSGWYWRATLLDIDIDVDSTPEITMKDRELYDELYHISPEDQIRFEQEFNPNDNFWYEGPTKSYDEGYRQIDAALL